MREVSSFRNNSEYEGVQEPEEGEHAQQPQHNTTSQVTHEPATETAFSPEQGEQEPLDLKSLGYGDAVPWDTSHRAPKPLPDVSHLHGTYDPMATLRQRNQEEANGGLAHYQLERQAPDTGGSSQTHQLPTGPISSKKGRGKGSGAPFINSRKNNYDGAKVGTSYNEIVSVLNNPDPKRQEKIANAILMTTRDKGSNLDGFTDAERRAMSHLIGITQLAEQHPNRTPGSAALARGSLQRISDGVSTFRQEFNNQNGNYVPAREPDKSQKLPGGTQQMRDFLNGTRSYPGGEDAAAAMSEDEPDTEITTARNEDVGTSGKRLRADDNVEEAEPSKRLKLDEDLKMDVD